MGTPGKRPGREQHGTAAAGWASGSKPEPILLPVPPLQRGKLVATPTTLVRTGMGRGGCLAQGRWSAVGTVSMAMQELARSTVTHPPRVGAARTSGRPQYPTRRGAPKRRAAARSGRVSRLLEIVTLLQSRSGWSATALAEHFRLSRTRIYNDVRALRNAGVPVQASRAGYRIDPAFFMPSLRLTVQEIRALLFPFGLFSGAEIGEKTRLSACTKLLSCLPEPLRTNDEELLRRARLVIPLPTLSDEALATLREAVVHRRRIRIIYPFDLLNHDEEIDIDPCGLEFRGLTWSVIAYSPKDREVRAFDVARIGRIAPTPLHFTTPRDSAVDNCSQMPLTVSRA